VGVEVKVGVKVLGCRGNSAGSSALRVMFQQISLCGRKPRIQLSTRK
jgi:hypothetical protein